MFKRTAMLALLALTAGLAACGDDSGPTDVEEERDPLTVMTRNLYLGADIGPILAAPSPEEVPARVGQAWATIEANDFPARARAVAQEIAESDAHVVGIQEAAIFRIQSPGDFLQGNPVQATEVAYDYLEILLDELESLGESYQAVTSVENVDVELPAATSPTSLIDVRYTDRDVILVRSDVTFQGAQSGNFSAQVEVPVAGAFPLPIPRGWNRVDVTHDGATYHVVNAHLEIVETSPEVQELQAQEVVDMVASVSAPTLVMGDLNGAPNDVTDTYTIITSAGFEDAWLEGGGTGSGLTCCFEPDLAGGTLFKRIDYILARGSSGMSLEVQEVYRVGGELATAPSDHAGIVATVVDGS